MTRWTGALTWGCRALEIDQLTANEAFEVRGSLFTGIEPQGGKHVVTLSSRCGTKTNSDVLTAPAKQDFVATAFDAVGLDWREHTMIDQTLFRPTEIMVGQGDPSKAAEKLGWKPKYKMAEVVRMMVQAAIEADE
jgi:GDP-D-mannose dehydratase